MTDQFVHTKPELRPFYISKAMGGQTPWSRSLLKKKDLLVEKTELGMSPIRKPVAKRLQCLKLNTCQ